MKKEFYELMCYKDAKKIVKKEGDYDSNLNVYYHKESNGWAATDEYTGSSILVAKNTKKDVQDGLKAILNKLTEFRNSEKYLQSVINYQEMLDTDDDDNENDLPF